MTSGALEQRRQMLESATKALEDACTSAGTTLHPDAISLWRSCTASTAPSRHLHEVASVTTEGRIAVTGKQQQDRLGRYPYHTRGVKTVLLDDYTIEVDIIISEPTNGKGAKQRFFDALGDNPLHLKIMPVVENNYYKYSSMIRLNSRDTYASDQIVSIVRNAYGTLSTILPKLSM